MTNSFNQKSRILLVGFTVPNDVIERICSVDRFMPVQTHKFSWSVVRGLEANDANVDLLSAEPVGNYPSNPQIIFKHVEWKRDNASWNIMMPFVNLLGLKHITRFLACLFLTAWWLLQTRHETNRVIMLHGVHSPFMCAVLALRNIFRFNAVTIVSDPPGVSLQGEGFLIWWLRRTDTTIITKALQSMNGLVTLTHQLAKHYAPLVPSIVIEGILNADNLSSKDFITRINEHNNEDTFVVFYAGGVSTEYGVDLLIDAFSRINCPSFRLWICGKGEFEEQVVAASSVDSRVVYMGYRPQGEVQVLLNRATVLINPRPSKQYFTKFSFPSKTIEYMVSGRPVISTRLPGIPEDYFSFLFILDEESPKALSDLLMRLYSMPSKDLNDFGAKAKTFVLENKNEYCQGRKIYDFLKKL